MKVVDDFKAAVKLIASSSMCSALVGSDAFF